MTLTAGRRRSVTVERIDVSRVVVLVAGGTLVRVTDLMLSSQAFQRGRIHVAMALFAETGCATFILVSPLGACRTAGGIGAPGDRRIGSQHATRAGREIFI